MPLQPMADMPIRPLIVVMPLRIPDGRTPMDVLMSIASTDPTASVVDIADLVAVRVESEADLTDSFDTMATDLAPDFGVVTGEGPITQVSAVRMAATRVRYLIGDPADAERWVDVYFSIDHPVHDLALEAVRAAVEMFDEQIQTFRWTS